MSACPYQSHSVNLIITISQCQFGIVNLSLAIWHCHFVLLSIHLLVNLAVDLSLAHTNRRSISIIYLSDVCFATPVTPIGRSFPESPSASSGKRTPSLEDKTSAPTSGSELLTLTADAERTSRDFFKLTRKCLKCLYNEREDPSMLGPKHLFKIYSGQFEIADLEFGLRK